MMDKIARRDFLKAGSAAIAALTSIGAAALLDTEASAEEVTEETVSDERITAVETKLSRLNKDRINLPEYWQEHIAMKIKEIQNCEKDSGISGDSFVFLTDYHYGYNAQNSPLLIKYIMQTTGVNKVFFGGDLIDRTNTDTDEINADISKGLEYLSPILDRAYMVIGNHEHGDPGAKYAGEYSPGWSALYSMFGKRRELEIGWVDSYGHYWIDNKVQKIRYFFVGCTYNAKFKAEMAENLMKEFENVPRGYTVVLVSHLSLAYNKDGTNDLERIALSSRAKFVEVLDALEKHNGNDFTVAAVIGGHNHKSMMNTWRYSFPVISTQSDCFARVPKDTSHYYAPMTEGTATEQCFDVVFIDKENRHIKLVRVGAGENREAYY